MLRLMGLRCRVSGLRFCPAGVRLTGVSTVSVKAFGGGCWGLGVRRLYHRVVVFLGSVTSLQFVVKN